MDRFSKLSKLLLWAALSTTLSAEAAAPPSPTAEKSATAQSEYGPPPFELNDSARIAAGKARFGANCAAYCHGHEGSGGKVAAFKGRKDLQPEELFKVITHGRRGADIMPAWGNGFSAEKRWELVAYIMYLSAQPSDN